MLVLCPKFTKQYHVQNHAQEKRIRFKDQSISEVQQELFQRRDEEYTRQDDHYKCPHCALLDQQPT